MNRFNVTLSTILLLPVVMTACNQSPNELAGMPPIADIRSVGSHYIVIEFAGAADAMAGLPSSYNIVDGIGNPLPIHDAALADDGGSVRLTTGQQTATEYLLSSGTLDDTLGSLRFLGSTQREPFLESAIALGNTQLLLTFSAQMQPADLENLAYYEIDSVNGAASTIPRITAAVAGSDSRTVVLTTTPLERVDYSIRATNMSRRYTCADDGRVFMDGAAQGHICSPSLRPTTTAGTATEFVVSARQNENPANNALVTGMAGYVLASEQGLGVGDTDCSGGSPSIDGDDSFNGGNEELIFTPDVPILATDVLIGLAHVDFGNFAQSDEPGIFISSTASATFDHAFGPADIEAAFNYDEETTFSSPNDSAGDVVFSDLPGLAGVMIDQIKFRVGQGEVYVGSICGLPVGGRLIDPTRNTARFLGMAGVDNVDPQLLSASAPTDRSVILSFNEPLSGAADNPTFYTIDNGLEVLTAELAQHDTQIILTTPPLNTTVTYEVTVNGVQDRSGNLLDAAADSAMFAFRGGPASLGAEALPRVVGARSSGNTSAIVTFSKPMGPSAEDAGNYVIVQQDVNPEVGALSVSSATFVSGRTDAVELVTTAQNEVTYFLTVVNVLDQSGNQLAPPELLVNPATASFPGTPFSCPDGVNCNLPDTDGDGLPDTVEQRGYLVTVDLGDGEIEQREVTSDPTSSDTDGDGLGDALELNIRSDPRLPDTDGDTLTDFDEYNVFYSETNALDSDEDGLDDAIEVDFYRTSPILDDTDGDGFTDTEEVIEFNRNPRIADLPQPGINIGNMRITIDERYSTTTEEGESLTVESSSSTTLAQSQDTSFSSSDTDVTGSSREIFVNGGVGAEFGTDGINGSITAEAGVTWNSHSEHTMQFTEESTLSAQNTYEQSIAKGQELSTTTSVTREVVDARIDLDLTIENEGDIAFAMTNLEISVLQSTGLSLTDFEPIGTLLANSELITGDDAVFNLGPFTGELGPFIFRDRDVFPNDVDSLLSNPRGLLFEIANYDILDEFGRNFAFASQTARDRTAGITVDYGDGTVERYLVATAGVFDNQSFAGGGYIGGFDGAGAAAGLSLDFILQDTLGLTRNGTTPDGILAGPDGVATSIAQGDDIQLIPEGTEGLPDDAVVIGAGENGSLDTLPNNFIPAGCPGADCPSNADDFTEVISGYATLNTCSANTAVVNDPNNSSIAIDGPGFVCVNNADCPGAGTCSGPEMLARVRNRQTGDGDRAWVVFSSGQIPAGADFSQIVLRPGDDLTLAFIQDIDRDGLFAREEYLYGSSDKEDDTDGDGLGDFSEVRVGWEVVVEGEEIRQVYPDPRVPDSDGDGIWDGAEQDLRRVFCHCDGGSNGGEPCGDDAGCPGGMCACDVIRRCPIGPDEGNICSAPSECRPAVTETPCNSDADCAFLSSCNSDGFCEFISLCGVFPDAADPTLLDIFASTDEPLRSDPRSRDSDADGVFDPDEIGGYLYGLSIRDGTNEVSETQALSDDVQQVIVGNTVGPSGVIILPGANGVIDSTPGGDDTLDSGTSVATSPLDPDHDDDTRPDGQERDAGSNPIDPNDSLDFIDSDRDGLSDAFEEQVGWTVNTDTAPAMTVYSSRFVADTDFDGLPDLLERELKSNPNRADTDGDGLLDFDEFAGFANYIILGNLFPGFVLDGAGSLAIGTDLDDTDTDGDGRTDYEEQFEGWLVPVGGNVQTVMSSPLLADGDLDGLNDSEEEANETDPQNPDTDGDGRSDGDEVSDGFDPLLPDLEFEVRAFRIEVSGGDDDDNGTSKWYWSLDATVYGSVYQSTEITNAEDSTCVRDSVDEDCGAINNNPFTELTCTGNQGSESFSMQEGDELVLEFFVTEFESCPENDSNEINCSGLIVVEIPFAQIQSEAYTFESLSPILESPCEAEIFVEVTRE